ncbi:MAG: hypothetical protein MJY69_07830 [Bacteroidales bacterium]|nr:hypothetical protein [Bacteroidales bacterium]
MMSAVLKNLREGTGFDKPAKLPASLKGMCPEQIVALLIQTYRTAVEQRGIAYIDITNAEAGRNIVDVVNWMYKTPAYRSTLFLQGTVGSGKEHDPPSISNPATSPRAKRTTDATRNISVPLAPPRFIFARNYPARIRATCILI